MSGEDIIRDTLKGYSEKKKPEGIDFFNNGQPEFISFDKIPTSKNKSRFNLKERIEDWVARDFVIYALQLYKKRYDSDWGLTFTSSCQEILKVQDMLYDYFGFCGKIIVKDYLDYFFEYYCDSFMQKQKQFYFSQMMKPWVLESFMENYDYAKRLNNEVLDNIFSENMKANKDSNKENTDITNEHLEDAYLLSAERLVLEYGVLLSINWLYRKKGFSLSDAAKYILTTCKGLFNKGKIETVIKATERYNPYPVFFDFKQADVLFERVDESLNVQLVWTEDSKFKFLLKGEA